VSVLRLAESTLALATELRDLALRLAPEIEDGDEDAAPPPLSSERAVTTLKSFSLGLP
jgi:mxaK protein